MGDTLREYLVGLGFSVDESSWRRFDSMTARAAGRALQLGAEATTASLAVAAMVERVGRYYEELYYASQRTGTSIENLRSYGLAAKQVGLTFESLKAAQDSFSAAQRLNPGIAALARRFSTATDKGDQLVETIENMKKQFGEPGYFMAVNFAQLLGLDEPTFKRLWDNIDQFKKGQADAKKLADVYGVKTGKEDAEAWVALMREINPLLERFQLIGQRIAQDFLPHVKTAVAEMTKLIDAFAKFNNETDGKAGMVAGGLAAGGGTLIAGWLAKRMLGLGGTATASATGTAAGSSALALMRKGGLSGAAIGSLAALKEAERPDWEQSSTGRWMREQRYAFRKWMGIEQDADDERVFGKGATPEKPAASPKPTAYAMSVNPAASADEVSIGNVKGMNADLVERLRKMRNEMPAEMGGFQLTSGYRSPEDQARLYANRHNNPYPVAPPGRSAHEQGEAADIKFETPAADQWFRAQMSKYGISSPVAGDPIHFERSERRQRPHPFLGNTRADLVPAPDSGAGNVTLNQRTEITVEASPSATATGQEVLAGQQRVNGDAVRNLGAKIR